MSHNPEPRFLIIETSGRAGQVALASGESIIARQKLDAARRHARDLAPGVLTMLQEVAWRPADLDAVIVNAGPGSYTGLRVGLMSAKTLAYASGCMLICVSAFHSIAQQARQSIPSKSKIAVIEDAQQGKVYVQEFSFDPDGLPTEASPLSIQLFTEWAANADQSLILTGPAVDKFDPSISEYQFRTVEQPMRTAQPESLLAIGLTKHAAQSFSDIWKAEPIYLRPSAAEEQMGKKFGLGK